MSLEKTWIKKLENILATALTARTKIVASEYIDDLTKGNLLVQLDALINVVNAAITKIQNLAPNQVNWEQLEKDIANYKG